MLKLGKRPTIQIRQIYLRVYGLEAQFVQISVFKNGVSPRHVTLSPSPGATLHWRLSGRAGELLHGHPCAPLGAPGRCSRGQQRSQPDGHEVGTERGAPQRRGQLRRAEQCCHLLETCAAVPRHRRHRAERRGRLLSRHAQSAQAEAGPVKSLGKPLTCNIN